MNEINELEDILDSILRGVQETLQAGQTIPEDLQRVIAEEINYLTDEIDRLYRVQGDPPILPPPDLPPAPIPSSNINAFSYDPDSERLYVKFQGDYPQQNGPIYSYDNVPEVIFNLFRQGAVPARTDGHNDWGEWWRGKVPSLGASLFTLIKNGNYPYQRLTP